MPKKLRLSLAALLAGAGLAPAAHADDWRYIVTPYLWLAGMDGKFAVNSNNPPVEVEQDFGDIFDTLQLAFMGKFEAQNGPLSIITDLTYADIGNAGVVNSPNFTAADVGTETFLGNAAVGYRFWEEPGNWVDAIVGARYTFTKLDITLNRTVGSPVSAGEDENWGDVFIGMRGGVELNDVWTLTGYGDIGAGWSDYTWQIYAGVDYRLMEGISLFGGYRAYKDKYDNDGYLYNVTQQGPIFGANFEF